MSVEQRLNWNDGEIDFSGRGGDRGLRGIAIAGKEIFIAASNELFCFTPDFKLKCSYRNRYLRHCHEIDLRDNTLLLSSTGFDSVLGFDLSSRAFSDGFSVFRENSGWRAKQFDPRGDDGPAPSHRYHINMVRSHGTGIYLSGLHTNAVLFIDAAMSVSETCTLPPGTHNAQPLDGGVIYNDTRSDVIRHIKPNGTQSMSPVPRYPQLELQHVGLDQSCIARQAFARGLCILDEHYLAGGSSPSTISLYDRSNGSLVKSINLSMDIRNAIHGLELWPFQ